MEGLTVCATNSQVDQMCSDGVAAQKTTVTVFKDNKDVSHLPTTSASASVSGSMTQLTCNFKGHVYLALLFNSE